MPIRAASHIAHANNQVKQALSPRQRAEMPEMKSMAQMTAAISGMSLRFQYFAA